MHVCLIRFNTLDGYYTCPMSNCETPFSACISAASCLQINQLFLNCSKTLRESSSNFGSASFFSILGSFKTKLRVYLFIN